MRVTQLQACDASHYRALMLEAYELAADAFTSTAGERASEPLSFWAKRIANPAGLSTVFGAFEGQELIGAVALEFSEKPKTKHKAHIIGMYVAPAARGTGAGRALVRAVIAHASANDGLSLLNLTVTEGNAAAVNLYRSVGFQEFGVEPMAVLTPSGFKAKIHMWLPLERGATAD